jgi:hypothetical protein
VLTTRTDRLIVLISFVLVFAVILAILSAFGALGAVEIILLFVIAIPVSIFVSRAVQARRGRPSPPPAG